MAGSLMRHADQATFRGRLRGRLRHEGLQGECVDDLVRDEQSVWRILFDASRDGIVILNTEGQVVEANTAFCNMLGYEAEELAQLKVWDWDDVYSREQLLPLLKKLDLAGTHMETRHRRKDGRIIDVEMSNNSILYAGERLIFCICRDITERKEYERRIQLMATTDALTGLLNRREFNIRLQQTLLASETSGGNFSVILFDIDHFKAINDQFGHAIGDQVLIRVAALVQKMVRNTDSLARWGGEEFVLLLPGAAVAEAERIANNIREAIAGAANDPVERITASFGVAEGLHGDTPASVIRRADHAMYDAKGAGRNCVRVIKNDRTGPVCCP